MLSKKRTISVRLDAQAARRLEMAAKLMKQSRGAFLERAGDELARGLLLDWAVARYRRGGASFSELAEETGLAVEEIMEATGQQGQEAALEMFLASCQTIAQTQNKPEFLSLAQEAAETVRATVGVKSDDQ